MDTKVLLEALRMSVRELVRGESHVAVAYSGGIDSSVIAALASEVADVKCYSAVMPGSHDARNVRASADAENISLDVIMVSDNLLKELVVKVTALVGHESPMAAAYTIPLIAVVNAAKEGVVLAGNGADELFGGYAKYLTNPDPRKQMGIDLEKAVAETEALRQYTSRCEKTIEFPFLSARVQGLANSIAIERKIQGTSRKVVLREVARELGLPSQDRPKKAAQYSSGVLRGMERLAKAEGKSIYSWIGSLIPPG
ncbi:MAG TPA: asparagine synthase-related protein [Thermoplasmata archaeon]